MDLWTIQDHWLKAAEKRFSPNFDLRPQPDDISLIVIHGITLPPNVFGGDGVDQLFTNSLDPNAHPFYASIQHLRVSTHLFIRRDGAVVQYVPFNARAWHAGKSSYQGREVCNDFSIGIELEGTDEHPYCEEQYRHLDKCVQSLLSHYPKTSRSRIVGHNEIAPGRKTDPGLFFDWERIRY